MRKKICDTEVTLTAAQPQEGYPEGQKRPCPFPLLCSAAFGPAAMRGEARDSCTLGAEGTPGGGEQNVRQFLRGTEGRRIGLAGVTS